jgi:DNA-binding transcriptional LysR family regulator
LHISQPAVSKQLREFEKSLGVALFHRLSTGVRLTEAVNYCRNMRRASFVLEVEAEQALEELRVLERGRLIVGASSTIGTYLLPEVCAQFQQRYPKIELHLEINNTEDVQRRLLDNKIDLALTEGLVNYPEIEADAFYWDEVVAVAAPFHPCCERAL